MKTAVEHSRSEEPVPPLSTSAIRDLGRLEQLASVLRTELSKRYGTEMPAVSLRFLSERELDEDAQRTGDPFRRFQLVAFSAGSEIAFNPHADFASWRDFLGHEIGHAALDARGFDVEPYGPGGVMGSRRVYHEEAADLIQRDAREILLKAGEGAGFWNRLDRLLDMEELFRSPSPLERLMRMHGITMKQVLEEPERILAAHPETFAPRRY